MELKWVIPVCALLLAGCEREQWDDCITSTGPERIEERAVGGFHTVDLSDRVDLVLEPRASGTVAVEAGRNLLGQVGTEVRDSVLYIANDNRCNWVRSFKPRITVHVPVTAVRKLVLRGTGDVSCTDTLRVQDFRVEQHGAQGTTDLLLDVHTCAVGLHTGAGDVRLRGRCTSQADLYSGIMAPIDASQLRARFVAVNNSGIADIRCWATEGLDAQLYSVGDVYYRGDPGSVQSLVLGEGRLIRTE
jgi:hypothetical protein